MTSASKSLTDNWNDKAHLTEVLSDITRDERIMGAAACTPSGALLAWTQSFPREFSCAQVHRRMIDDAARDGYWSMAADLPSGAVHLSATEVQGGVGTVVLVHDLGFLRRRESTTSTILIIGYLVLSVAASIVTLLAARFAWRGWTTALRRALSGESQQELQPLEEQRTRSSTRQTEGRTW